MTTSYQDNYCGGEIPEEVGADGEHINKRQSIHGGSATTQVQTQQKRTRSFVWNYFTRLETNRNRCKCNYCGKDLSCATTSGTTNLKNHLNTCSQYHTWESRDVQQNINNGSGETTDKVQVGTLSESVFREATNEMLVLGELPLSFIESLAWRGFCRKVQLYRPHSRRTATRDLVHMYVKRKTTLKNLLAATKQRVSLTTDIWVAPTTGASYMVITCHFVDSSWTLRKLIIGFKHVLDHKGGTIDDILLECLAEWAIEKVFTITVDNATTNSNALKKFSKMFQELRSDALLLSGEFLHVRCAAYILNLIVKDGMQSLSRSVTAIRNVVVYVRASGTRLDSFGHKLDSGSQAGTDSLSGGQTQEQEDDLVDVRVGVEKMAAVYNKLVNDEGFDSSMTELDMYLRENVESHKKNDIGAEFDILSWWRVNAPKYPVLSEVARDVLAMQVS